MKYKTFKNKFLITHAFVKSVMADNNKCIVFKHDIEITIKFKNGSSIKHNTRKLVHDSNYLVVKALDSLNRINNELYEINNIVSFKVVA